MCASFRSFLHGAASMSKSNSAVPTDGDGSFFSLEGGDIFPKTHPDKIKAPPNIPLGVSTSPRAKNPKRAPHKDMVVMRRVNSLAETTLSATVSKYKAKAVDINPVHRRAPIINGSPNHVTN